MNIRKFIISIVLVVGLSTGSMHAALRRLFVAFQVPAAVLAGVPNQVDLGVSSINSNYHAQAPGRFHITLLKFPAAVDDSRIPINRITSALAQAAKQVGPINNVGFANVRSGISRGVLYVMLDVNQQHRFNQLVRAVRQELDIARAHPVPTRKFMHVYSTDWSYVPHIALGNIQPPFAPAAGSAQLRSINSFLSGVALPTSLMSFGNMVLLEKMSDGSHNVLGRFNLSLTKKPVSKPAKKKVAKLVRRGKAVKAKKARARKVRPKKVRKPVRRKAVKNRARKPVRRKSVRKPARRRVIRKKVKRPLRKRKAVRKRRVRRSLGAGGPVRRKAIRKKVRKPRVLRRRVPRKARVRKRKVVRRPVRRRAPKKKRVAHKPRVRRAKRRRR